MNVNKSFRKKIGVGWVLLCVFVYCVWECWSICYCVYRALYRAQRHRVFCFHSCILEEISNFIHITCGWILMRLMVVCLWLLLWMWSCACTRWTLIQIYFCHMKDALTCNENGRINDEREIRRSRSVFNLENTRILLQQFDWHPGKSF